MASVAQGKMCRPEALMGHGKGDGMGKGSHKGGSKGKGMTGNMPTFSDFDLHPTNSHIIFLTTLSANDCSDSLYAKRRRIGLITIHRLKARRI